MRAVVCCAAVLATASALQCGVTTRQTVTSKRAGVAVMDETILEKALAGELEEEGAENVFMSEVGWASYLDKEAGQSYNMNERPSKAQDNYFTPDILSNPIDILVSWKDSMLRVASDPLEASFLTISNDKSGARSYGPGVTEVQSRTIKPKVKDFDATQRITGIPGYNLFGAPSTKSAGLPAIFGAPEPVEQPGGKKEKGPGLFEQIASFFG